MDIIYSFWTGGYDSTFVVLNHLFTAAAKLSGHIIQPVYLQNCDARKNADVEIAQMNKIRQLVYSKYPAAKNYLLPTIYIDCSQVVLDTDIQAGMASLAKQGKLRLPKSQYSYIAQAPRLLQHVVDSGAELAPGTCISQHVRSYLNEQAMLIPGKTPWYLWIFSGVRFPVVNTTKKQMYAIAQQKGFAQLLWLTITCRVPIRRNGKVIPCGKCGLCRERILK